MSLLSIGGVAIIGALIAGHKEFGERAKPYRAMIDRYSRIYDVSPHVLASLFWQESRFNPGAVGSVGEIGIGQISSIAATDLGIAHSALQNNVSFQIESSARFLRKMLDGAGDLYNGLRAYNVGLAGSRRNQESGAGYAVSILKNAFVDWVYGKLSYANR